MKRAIAITVLVLFASGCTNTVSSLTNQDIKNIAPDVPNITVETQDKALKEVDGGQCPALTDIAISCMITRDEARNMRSIK